MNERGKCRAPKNRNICHLENQDEQDNDENQRADRNVHNSLLGGM
jgi:hypothetical protein